MKDPILIFFSEKCFGADRNNVILLPLKYSSKDSRSGKVLKNIYWQMIKLNKNYCFKIEDSCLKGLR